MTLDGPNPPLEQYATGLLFFSMARFFDIASSIYGDEMNSHNFCTTRFDFSSRLAASLKRQPKKRNQSNLRLLCSVKP